MAEKGNKKNTIKTPASKKSSSSKSKEIVVPKDSKTTKKLSKKNKTPERVLTPEIVFDHDEKFHGKLKSENDDILDISEDIKEEIQSDIVNELEPDLFDENLDLNKLQNITQDLDFDAEDVSLQNTPEQKTKTPNTKAPQKTKNLPSTSSSRALVNTDPLSMYLAEIGRYALLTPEQEKALSLRYYEMGDQEAAELLVKSNLRFVVKIAAEYAKYGAKMIDLIQEGNVGLMHAVRDFNPYKGVRLITYAVWWIRGYIRDYLLKQHSLVRIGTSAKQKRLFYQLQREQDRLKNIGEELDIPLLSSKLGVTQDEVRQMQERIQSRDISLDQSIDGQSAYNFLNLQKDEYLVLPDEEIGKNQELHQLHAILDDLRPQLNEKEIYILENRLLADEGKTLQEIGNIFGISRERCRQIEERLMQKIKNTLIAKNSHNSEE